MAFCIKQHVFWFEVAVNNVVRVKSANSVDHFGGVDLSPLLAKLPLLAQVGKQLSSIKEIYKEVEFSLGLERVMKSHDVWVFDLFKNVSLRCSQKLGQDKNLPWVFISKFFFMS